MRKRVFEEIVAFSGLLIIGTTLFFILKQNKIPNKFGNDTTTSKNAPTITKKTSPTPSKNNYSTITDLPQGKIFHNDTYGVELEYKENGDYTTPAVSESVGKTWNPKPRNFDYLLELYFRLKNPTPFDWARLFVAISKNTNNLNLNNLDEVEKFVEFQLLYEDDRKFDSRKKIKKWNKEVVELYINYVDEGAGERTFYVVKNHEHIITVDKYISTPDTINSFNKILDPIIDNIKFF